MISRNTQDVTGLKVFSSSSTSRVSVFGLLRGQGGSVELVLELSAVILNMSEIYFQEIRYGPLMHLCLFGEPLQ